MTKRELIEALEALDCSDDTEVEILHCFNLTEICNDDYQVSCDAPYIKDNIIVLG